MLEIKCQGAVLTRFFTIWASQSPWAEVQQDGRTVGRTRPHQGGDKNPRWDDPPFVLDPSKGQLLFRVLIPSSSVMGHKDVLCGEGAVAVADLLRQQHQFMLPLHKGGDPTGYLTFQWRMLGDSREVPRQPHQERPVPLHGQHAPAAPYPPAGPESILLGHSCRKWFHRMRSKATHGGPRIRVLRAIPGSVLANADAWRPTASWGARIQ
eukprot:symbB.v1.2.023258.t1/scaffold2112.1/size106475/8